MENIEYIYDINKIESFLKMRFKSTKYNILNQLQYSFRYESHSEDVIFPRNFEILIRKFGIIGFVLNDKKFAHLSIVDFDDENNPAHYVGIGLGTNPKSYGTLAADEVIPCFNNPLGLSDLIDINYFAYEKAQNDISRMYQLINSRNIPMLKTDSDKVMDQILKALDDVKAGKPAVITTKIMDELEKLDILDPNMIGKMEYLTSYDEVLDKNIANRFGASLDIKDKKAQVNNAELKAYDDITTQNYLVNYESRLEFINRMKEEGYDVELIVSPIFADEPQEEDIEHPDIWRDDEEEFSDAEDNLQNIKDKEDKGNEED